MMLIRQATVEDLSKCGTCAAEFYASVPSLGIFELERFVAMWTTLLGNGMGVMFLLLDGDEIVGALGGVTFPDQYSPRLIATEFFWHVGKAARGRGVLLYKMFEGWARKRGCHQIRMGHMLDSMPEKVAKFYQRMGYKAIEVNYAKDLTA